MGGGCHFFHSQFHRCAMMDPHMVALAAEHPETRFFKIDVEKSPFFVEKLDIIVLPTLICFKKGNVVKRYTGFDEFGGQDDFTNDLIEEALFRADMISETYQMKKNRKKKGRSTVFGYEESEEEDIYED
ncbi:hypothetical protein KIPB_000193 [Kipferlia bialata]|uniref:Thioredoxin domain-containing protein n=1 Tax=Kipferlia bialata TaxID=797122 RepID=A0A9K3CM62_9EUKA|nr:hypothetical protein KIPB_000193 [Kipferlia bialata]|eukprot:g193.t1